MDFDAARFLQSCGIFYCFSGLMPPQFRGGIKLEVTMDSPLISAANCSRLLEHFALLERAHDWTGKAIQQVALACLNDIAESRSCQRITLARAQFPLTWRRVYAVMKPYLNDGLVIKGKTVKFVGNYAALRQVVADLRTYVRANGSFPELPKVKRTQLSAYDRIAEAIRKNANADKRIGVLLNAIELIESSGLEF